MEVGALRRLPTCRDSAASLPSTTPIKSMARNRKSESGVRLAPALTALALCALFVTLGVGFVWFKNQIGVLGDQIKKSEIRLAELERQNRTRRDQLGALCSPVALDERVRKLDPGLGPTAPAQVIHMVEWPPDGPAATAGQQRAQGTRLAGNS